MGVEKAKARVYDHGAMLELYRQGLSDPEIARRVGCTASNVYKWRKSNGLEPNVPAHGGYGRPVRKREDPLPESELPPMTTEPTLYTECPRCVYNGSLNHGTADTFCAYGLITGQARIKLPKREDGRCPAFASADVFLGGERDD